MCNFNVIFLCQIDERFVSYTNGIIPCKCIKNDIAKSNVKQSKKDREYEKVVLE